MLGQFQFCTQVVRHLALSYRMKKIIPPNTLILAYFIRRLYQKYAENTSSIGKNVGIDQLHNFSIFGGILFFIRCLFVCALVHKTAMETSCERKQYQ